ncbi:aryl-sulfate sulfotransferase [Planococcus sp. APC 3900]|uniref:aryl-sulfate sulfotransferase n=1 Tax=Planococcus sp. APC 3900 TaxID=3035191 RepID=UPI0025B60F86|nr:aryl-sulfate sulfotransferase [Planococcus sp. APC 3900]MDN3437333.1 aryl-sulfate sulfotransferase [Planococcus sp. APC 3900]
MKRKIWLSGAALLVAGLLTGCSEEVKMKDHGEIEVTVEELEFLDTRVSPSSSAYDVKIVDRLQEELDALKQEENYKVSEPLAVMNPFGTNTTGLYLHFQAADSGTLTYTVSAEGTADFTRDAKDANPAAAEAEYQVIGLVPGKENTVKVTYINEEGTQGDTYSFKVAAPATTSGYPITMEQTASSGNTELADGLFALMGVNNYDGYTFLFDNAGTMRAEIISEDYRMDRMVAYEDSMVFTTTDQKLARMNPLGKITDTFELNGYVMHHDFVINEDGQVLTLVSDPAKNTVEDLVMSIDLNTGEQKLLVDFNELLSGYKQKTKPVETDGKSVWDWLHFNSIDLAGDSLILSARENSTIVKVDDIYTQPTINYLIGIHDVWEGTEGEELRLKKSSEFPSQAGQHSVTYVADDSLPEGQYYLYMYNNNYWWYESRPDYTGAVIRDTSQTFEANDQDRSKFTKFLVDETNRSYDRVQEFDVPYSSIVSNAQATGDSIVINSGMAKTLEEYSAEGELLAQFKYEASTFSYRAYKYNFTDFWFE